MVWFNKNYIIISYNSITRITLVNIYFDATGTEVVDSVMGVHKPPTFRSQLSTLLSFLDIHPNFPQVVDIPAGTVFAASSHCTA